MSTTVLGYNRDPSTGAAVQVTSGGVALVDKDGNALSLPAGHIVVEVRLKHVSTTTDPAGATDVIVCIDGGDDLVSATATELIDNDHVSVVGNGSVSAPTLAKTDDCDLLIKGDADWDDNGATFCCVLKHKPMPTL